MQTQKNQRRQNTLIYSARLFINFLPHPPRAGIPEGILLRRYVPFARLFAVPVLLFLTLLYIRQQSETFCRQTTIIHYKNRLLIRYSPYGELLDGGCLQKIKNKKCCTLLHIAKLLF